MLKPGGYRHLRWITVGVVLAGFLACAGGLIWNGLYRDPPAIAAAWYTNDLVTLLIVLPLVIVCLPSRNTNSRQLLIWLGCMLYILYNYCFYLFGAAFNVFFLLYVALVALSMFGLVTALVNLDKSSITQRINYSKRHRIVSAFLLVTAVPLAIVEIRQCVRFIIHGILPQIPTLIFALDLTLVIPNIVLAAMLLWQQKAWGYILTAMMLVKASTYGLVLVTGTILIAVRQVGPLDPLLPYYIFVVTGGIVFSWLFFQTIRI